MANEILAAEASGLTCYALILNTVGQIYNGAAFEAYAAGNWSTYARTLTERTSTGQYLATMPALPAGAYRIAVYLQAGASPAIGDVVMESYLVDWDGTVVTALSSRLAPTTAGRTLDVSATGEAGLDFDNIKDATGAHNLANITVPTVTTVTNYTAPDNAGISAAAASAASADSKATLIKAKTDNLPMAIKKNVALDAFEFAMIDHADHVTLKTGLTVTAQRSLDGGAFGACANAVVEVGSGVYKIDLAAADLNGNIVTLKFTAAGADTTLITLVTQS